MVGVLSVLLIALAVYTVTLFNDNKAKISTLETQKADIEKELEGLILNYDEVIRENELKDKDLLAARDRISVLLDSVKSAQANVVLIERYKNEIEKLKRERSLLFKRADSLIAANKRLAVQIDSTSSELESTRMLVDSISQENISMSQTIKTASVVRATALKGEAVIIRKNGKLVSTQRASRADKIRACFMLSENAVAKAGDRTLYVQVTNPKNNIIGEQASIAVDDEVIFYSASTNVYYENKELDVCMLVDAEVDDLLEGTYHIRVFDGITQVAETSMELR